MVPMRIPTMGSLAALLLISSAFAQPAKPLVEPGKIYVGNFGMSEDAEQLRLALDYELGQAGLKVVDYQAQADTVLSGLIVTRIEEGKPAKRVTVFLKDRHGKMIWNQDFGSAYTASKSAQDGLRQRAEEIARALKRNTEPARATPAPSIKKSPAPHGTGP